MLLAISFGTHMWRVCCFYASPLASASAVYYSIGTRACCIYMSHALVCLLLAPYTAVQLIHSDANENNIIVDEAAQEVVALIDW